MDFLLGLDPGKDKFGWAFVDRGGALLASGVIPAARAAEFMDALLAGNLGDLASFTVENFCGKGLEGAPVEVLLGNGTARSFLGRLLESRSSPFKVVDEAYTTLEARHLFWVLHPPRGLARLFPESLRVPPRPIDDLAAWALVRRALSGPVRKDQDVIR